MIVRTGVRGLSFTNVVFEHVTWLGPSTPIGFVDVQAGFCLACAVGEEENCLPDPGDSPEHPPPPSLKFRETPAALAFHGSKGVRFDSCTFQHLGANGVSFSGGSQNNTVTRCTFVDLSASAVSRTIAANAALNFQRSERAGRSPSARGAIRRSAARSTSRTRATKSRTAASLTWRESTAATPRCWQASAAGKPHHSWLLLESGPTNDFSTWLCGQDKAHPQRDFARALLRNFGAATRDLHSQFTDCKSDNALRCSWAGGGRRGRIPGRARTKSSATISTTTCRSWATVRNPADFLADHIHTMRPHQ